MAIFAGVLLIIASAFYHDVAQWQALRDGCRVGNAARDERNLGVRANRRGWEAAARARTAAYRRDGNKIDRVTAQRYFQIVRDLNTEVRRDCIEAFPPPFLVPESLDSGNNDPLSRPRQ